MDKQIYTFLFTDIEGSTRLWQDYPDAMSITLARHNEIIAQTITSHQGKIFSSAGDGACSVFNAASDALAAAIAAFRGLHQAQETHRFPVRLKVRIGLHTGEAEERNDEYFGITLNRVARLTNAANGWQILLTSDTKKQLPASLPDGAEYRDLGRHYLRDIREPEYLYQVIVPDVPISYAPIRTLSPRPSNLTAALTSFIGRERETQDITRRLRHNTTRLLTLTGTGGIGKTRLSQQAGSELRDDYADGVFFVDLAPLTQPEAVIEAIAGVLKVEEGRSSKPVDALKNYLQDRHLLLILDNFEQVLDAAPYINQLLGAAPRLSVLVTSREPLRIYGEQPYLVLPLELPALTDEPDIDIPLLIESASVRLFVNRVQVVQPDFALNDVTAPQVHEICRRLDGLPLALELAAARLSDMALPDIVEQLATRLTLLTHGPRDISTRHQTIRATIDWSYERLPLPEQHAFATLGIFVGQFTAQAAVALIDETYQHSLVRKSLLQTAASADRGQAYVMLETVREYARERLVALGTLAETQRKHADYYCHLVESAEAHLTGAAQIEWFRRLDEVGHNLSAALEWAASAGEWEIVGRMVAVLWRYWSTHSRLSEGSRWMARTLEQASSLPPLLHARILQGAGRLAQFQHEFSSALDLLQQSLALFQAEHHIHGQATSLRMLGEIAFQQGSTTRAEGHMLDSLALYRETDDFAGIARCLDNLGRLASRGGNFAAAEPLLEESLALTRQHGSSEDLALVLNNLAEAHRAQEKFADAARLYRESLEIYRRMGINIGVAVMLHNLAQVELPVGNRTTARDLFLEALELLKELDDRQIIAECLVGLGGVFLRTGEPVRAVRYLASGKALLDALDARMDYADQVTYDRHIAETHARMDAGVWQSAWQEGQSTPVDAMIAEALRSFGNKRRTATSEIPGVDPATPST